MRKFLWSLIVLLALIGCTPQNTPSSPIPSPTSLEPTSALTLDAEIKAAFAQTDPQTRRASVLNAVQRFLNEPAIHSISDADATMALTDAAFASGAIKLTDPAFVRRDADYAIVGLPDGLGLYFFAPSQPPLEISRWTVGLSTINPIWRDGGIGIAYETQGVDGALTSQFARLTQDEAGWRIAWSSSGVPDWWFNARNARLTIAPDLSQIEVIGQAPGTTLTFNESADGIQREFRIVWQWDEVQTVYHAELSSNQFAIREAWLWRIAVPSPYATLVEFIERLQRGETEGLSRLVVNDEIIEDATDFGFALLNPSYDVILNEPDRLVIRGYQGVFEFSFAPPAAEGEAWIITRIKVGSSE